MNSFTGNTNTTGNAGGNPLTGNTQQTGGQSQDYGDKAFDAIAKKSGHNVNPSMGEKITDGARGIFEKATGLVPPYRHYVAPRVQYADTSAPTARRSTPSTPTKYGVTEGNECIF